MNRSRSFACAALVGAALLVGCRDEDKPVNLAPTASALAPAKAPTASMRSFAVDKGASKVEFAMEAPEEKIHGRVSGGTEGTLNVDPTDLTKTTGLVTVDLSGLQVFQQVVDKDGGVGEEKKNDLQNTHARTWLEISDDAPEADKKKNARVEFSIQKIDKASEKDVTKMTGADRKVSLVATGEFLLHGRKTTKTAELEATFHFEGDKPTSVTIKSTKPFAVGLAEHDVHPREAFGKLAAKTLEVLAPKVAKEALVSVDLVAKPGGGGGAAPKGGEGDKPTEKAGEKPADKPAD